jgi:hypothetical protein
MLRALRRHRAWSAFLAIAVQCVAAASFAAEPATGADVCSPAYEGAQELRLDGKLVEARQQLMVCAQPSCPSFMQSDCARWDAELEALVPTVILTARDGDGRYLTDVQVSMDGQELAKRIDGRSLPINPGGHSFSFRAFGKPPVVLSSFVPEGAKGHVVQATLGAPTPTPAPPPRRASLVRPVALYTLSAVGVVGLAGFGIFAISGSNAEDDLRGQPCATTSSCTREQTDPVERKYLLADVSLGVGVVALGAATYLWLSGPSTPERAARLRIDVQPERAFASYSLSY